MNKKLSANVSGRVQGVGFRLFIKEWADKNAINGFVKNCDEGVVDIVIEGSDEVIQNMLNLLEQNKLGDTPGLSPISVLTSKLAKIDKVDYSWGDFENEFDSFTIIRENSIKKDQIDAFGNFFRSFFK